MRNVNWSSWWWDVVNHTKETALADLIAALEKKKPKYIEFGYTPFDEPSFVTTPADRTAMGGRLSSVEIERLRDLTKRL